MLRVFLKYVYALLFAFGFLVAAIMTIASHAPQWMLPLLLLCTIAISFFVEFWAPYEPDWNLLAVC